MKKVVALVTIIMLFSTVLVLAQGAKQNPKKMAGKSMMSGKGELAKSIEHGKTLFFDTKLGSNGMSCNSCHMAGGTMPGKMKGMTIKPFNKIAGNYPKYFMMAKKVMTFDQVINFCITMPLKGKALAPNDPNLTDLEAYIASVTPAAPGKAKK